VPSAWVDYTEVERDRSQRKQDAPQSHAFHRFASQTAIADENTQAQNGANRAVTATYPHADRFIPAPPVRMPFPAS
jgi:hypothetical protein